MRCVVYRRKFHMSGTWHPFAVPRSLELVKAQGASVFTVSFHRINTYTYLQQQPSQHA